MRASAGYHAENREKTVDKSVRRILYLKYD
jgi:hypothetical protein